MLAPASNVIVAAAATLSILHRISRNTCRMLTGLVGIPKTGITPALISVSDIASILLQENCFDVVLCIGVLEHVPDLFGALMEFARVLQDGGQLILTALFCSLTH